MRQLEYHLTILTRYFVVLMVLFFSLFVVPLRAVFRSAVVFNSDVSKWNTGSVTTMHGSKCVLVCYVFLIRQLDFQVLTRSVILLLLIFFFFVVPSLAVFARARAFNQDVSKWNTGAVTNMYMSTCYLSPSLWPHSFRCCVF